MRQHLAFYVRLKGTPQAQVAACVEQILADYGASSPRSRLALPGPHRSPRDLPRRGRARGQDEQEALGRHAPQALRGDRARVRPPRRRLPRRADHGRRRGHAPLHLGPRARLGGWPRYPAHHALHGRGRRACEHDRHHGGRPAARPRRGPAPQEPLRRRIPHRDQGAGRARSTCAAAGARLRPSPFPCDTTPSVFRRLSSPYDPPSPRRCTPRAVRRVSSRRTRALRPSRRRPPSRLAAVAPTPTVAL